MHIRIDQSQLAEALAWVANCAPNITDTPILSGLLISASDDTLSLSAFDWEVAATAKVEAQVDQAGSALVPARVLATIVKELPKGFPVTLQADGAILAVKSASGTFSLPLMPVEDYPQLPTLPTQVGEVDAVEWATAAKRAGIVAAKPGSPVQELTGVLLEFGDSLSVVGTDTYRLSASEIGWQATIDGGQPRPLLVPAASTALAAMATEGMVGIHFDNDDHANVVGFTTPARQVVTRLLDGPRRLLVWRTLIPTEPVAEVTLSSTVLDAVLRRAAPFVGNETAKNPATVSLTFADNQLTVTSGGGEHGAGSEVIPVDYTAEPLQVVCKIAYLREALKATGGDQISLSLTGTTKPLLVRPVNDAAFRHLVMPIRPKLAAAA